MAEKRLSRNVRLLGVVSLLNDASSEIIYPLLPVFLTAVLGAGPAYIGIIEGVAESTSALLKPVAGWWSDRLRRRKGLAVAGYALAGLVRPLLAVVSAPWQVLAVRFADRTGKGIRSAPRDALIADSAAPESRGYAFGFHRAMDHLGAVVGSLAGFALVEYFHGDLRHAFLYASLPAVFAVGIAAVGIRETPHAPRVEPAKDAVSPGREGISPGLRYYFAVLFLFTLGNSSDAFLLLKASEAGVATAHLPLLWGAHHAVKSLSSIPSGRLSDRLDRRVVIVGGWIVYAGVYLGFAFADSRAAVWTLFLLYGLYFGLTEGVERAYVADLAPPDRAGTALGIYHLMIGAGALPASLLTGFLWQRVGPAAALGLGAALAAVAAAALIIHGPAPHAARGTT